MSRRLLVTANAERQIRAANDWWRTNRQAGPDLLRSELERAFELVIEYPDAGPLARNPELVGIRRVLLQRTRFHLYYRSSLDAVEVLACGIRAEAVHHSCDEPPNKALQLTTTVRRSHLHRACRRASTLRWSTQAGACS